MNTPPCLVPVFPLTELPRSIAAQIPRLLAAWTEEDRERFRTGKYALYYNRLSHTLELVRIPKSERPFCHAKRRDGHKCKARVVPGRTRCRMHGGLSTGPKTEEGRERIRESNRRRAAEFRTGEPRRPCVRSPKRVP